MIRELPMCQSKVSCIEIRTPSLISFAHYYQPDAKMQTGMNIDWGAVTEQNNAVLLVSNYGMYCMPFSSDGEATWERSTLRRWLNGEWLDQSFVQDGNGFMVVPTAAADPLNVRSLLPYRKTVGSGLRAKTDDEDYVFLLSASEANRLLHGYVGLSAHWFADRTQLDGEHAVKWWTRPSSAETVNCITEDGESIYCSPATDGIFVRPAVWLDNFYMQRSISEVTDSWRDALRNAQRGVFDYDSFKTIAAATYKILHLYYGSAHLCVAYPKAVVEMIILITRYAETYLKTETNEHLLSLHAANAFCAQVVNWKIIYRRDPTNGRLGGFSNAFVMKDLNGSGIVVDADTFDMEHPMDTESLANDGCYTL